MIAIKVNNLSKNFKLYSSSGKRALEYITIGRLNGHTDFWALREISFEVSNGTSVGIIGQNGSGKSTLLSILAGVLEPEGGSFEVNGKVSAILELGSGFHPDFTGRANVYMYGSIMGLSKDEIDDKFDEILHFSELRDFIDQPLRTYSSGMIIRLAFSVAVNVNSDILIVDEALAVGDAIFQHRCFRKIREMQEAGKTILYVGHDTDAVRNLCSYAMLLDGGRIIERGDANTVVNKYHALIAERERAYDERNLEERGEILEEGYQTVYNFVDNLKNAKKKSLQPNYVREQIVEVKSAPRKIIFAHPPSEIEYDLVVEPGSSLTFAIGLLPGAWDKIKQGVRFNIKVMCEGLENNIFSKAIEPRKNKHEKGWNNFKICLEEYCGKEVTIKFITSGTSEDLSYCWGAWGWARVVIVKSENKNKKNDIMSPLQELSYPKREVRYGSKKAKIIKVELLDENEQPKLIFNSGDLTLIKIEVLLLSSDFDGQISIAYYIKNKFTNIYGADTWHYGLKFDRRVKSDVIKVKFKQHIKLGAGIYSLTASTSNVHSDDDFEILDRRLDCLLFRVEPTKKILGCVDLEATIEEI